MSSAALPTLPSVRAKQQLERASGSVESAVDQQRRSCDQSQPEKSEPSQNSHSQRNKLLRMEDEPPAGSTAFHGDTDRAEQLSVLNQKEQKAFEGLPPLEASVACNVIHHYIATTSSFLNSFVADANASHEGIDRKLSVLEKQMALLESKIASMPDLFPDESESDEEKNVKK